MIWKIAKGREHQGHCQLIDSRANKLHLIKYQELVWNIKNNKLPNNCVVSRVKIVMESGALVLSVEWRSGKQVTLKASIRFAPNVKAHLLMPPAHRKGYYAQKWAHTHTHIDTHIAIKLTGLVFANKKSLALCNFEMWMHTNSCQILC